MHTGETPVHDDFETTNDPSGATSVRSRRALDAYARAVCDDLRTWAAATPDATFVAERDDDGPWRRLTYGEAFRRARAIGAGLLAARASNEAPIAIVAENGIDHAALTLAALYVGVPVSPISVGYASPDAAPDRLNDLLAARARARIRR
jgi:feruloyl-CoA synthase